MSLVRRREKHHLHVIVTRLSTQKEHWKKLNCPKKNQLAILGITTRCSVSRGALVQGHGGSGCLTSGWDYEQGITSLTKKALRARKPFQCYCNGFKLLVFASPVTPSTPRVAITLHSNAVSILYGDLKNRHSYNNHIVLHSCREQGSNLKTLATNSTVLAASFLETYVVVDHVSMNIITLIRGRYTRRAKETILRSKYTGFPHKRGQDFATFIGAFFAFEGTELRTLMEVQPGL